MLVAVAPAAPVAAAPLEFLAVGDLPYAEAEAALLARLLAQETARAPAFVLHVGDIKGGSEPCTDARNREVASLFRIQPVPVVYTPGDNEWTDCHRERAGARDPLERLAAVRRMFFADPSVLHNQSLGLRVPVPDHPENAWLIRDDVLLAVLHVVGSGNAWTPRDPTARAAFEARAAANRRVLEAAAAAGQAARVRAAVLAFHANPLFEKPGHRGFQPFRQDLQYLLARFAGPVLLIHGDTHSYKLDRPVADPASGEPITRVQRLEVPGSPLVAGVRVSVEPDAETVFKVRMVYPSAAEDWLQRQ